mmetsp:Transcript_112286/g.198996  ORF Transcript_112286/g.198996 Transcript_112286/m.198996 type:complete len:783 (-) Transcript_112286:45-2393(-)
MARLRMVLLALVTAISLPPMASATARRGLQVADPRPNLTEWKETQAIKAEKAANATANQSKMAAVDKVIVMLEDLQFKILSEGNDEAKTYDKFACFCKDALAEKKAAIQEGIDSKATLTSEIGQANVDRDQLDTDLGVLEEDLKNSKEEVENLGKTNTAAVATFTKTQAEVTKAIRALENAIQVTKASRPASLLQLQSVAPTLRWAASMADALGELDKSQQASKAAAALLQQAPDVEMENYKFHSEGVIDMLEKLLSDTFRPRLRDLEDEETIRVQEYDKAVLTQVHFQESTERSIAAKTAQKAEKVSEIAAKSERLTTVSATLLEDKSYETELHTMCKKKAEVWDQRSTARANEIQALVSAIALIKDVVKEKTSASTVRLAQQGARVHFAAAAAHSEEAMEAVEADAESAEASKLTAPAAPTFLQKLRRAQSVEPHHAVLPQAVVDLLKSKGEQLKSSALTALASQLVSAASAGTSTGDPFKKVKQIITDLIAKLQLQASEEATWKSTCDKNYADEYGNRDDAVTAIRLANVQMAGLEATIETLTEEINTLIEEIAQLVKQREETDTMRAIEKQEHETAIAEAEAGLDGLNQAVTILKNYYTPAADNTVTYSLLQQSPAEDAPDEDFATSYEAYKGDQSTSSGIFGMLEVIKTDFNRTIEETKADEAAAVKEYDQFVIDNDAAQSEKNTAKGKKEQEKTTAEGEHSSKETHLGQQNNILKDAIKAIIQLNWTCRRKETGETYAERVARRDEEIAALNKALCILTNYVSYAGPALTAYDVCE